MSLANMASVTELAGRDNVEVTFNTPIVEELIERLPVTVPPVSGR